MSESGGKEAGGIGQDAILTHDLYFGNIDPAYPSREVWQDARQLVLSSLLSRLGDFHVSGLGKAFDSNDPPADVAKRHLSDMGWKVPEIHDDIHTIETLAPHVESAVDRPIIESTQVIGNARDDLLSAAGMRVGDIAVSFSDGKYSTRKIDHQLGQVRDGEYKVLPSKDGSLIVVSTTHPERYRATVDEGGNPHVYHEAVLALSADDASRFTEFGEDLKTYQDLLWRAIDEAGVDISSVRSKMERGDRLESEDFALLKEASKSVREYYATHESPVLDQMEMQAGLIMTARNQDTFTTAGRGQSMYYVARNIRAYFETVNGIGLDRNYHIEDKSGDQ